MEVEVEEVDAPPPPQHDAAATSDAGGGAGITCWAEEVEKMNSTHDSEETLRSLCRRYGISDKDYRPLCAKNGWGPCKAIPKAMCVYESMLEAGVRFPLHDFYAKFLRRCGIAPSQLTPNAWRYLAAFVLLCNVVKVQPMVTVFLHFFKLHAHGGKLQEGWHHVVPFQGRRLFEKSNCNLPSNDGWKKKFFFLESLSPDLPWRCPEKWGALNQAACSVRPDELKDAAWKAIKSLESVKETWSISQLLDKSRYDNKLPVLPSLQAAVKAEDSAGAAASTPPQKRKFRALSEITPPEQLAIAAASSPPGFISPGSADGGEHSVSHMMAGVLVKMQKTEKELSDAKRQLLKHEADVAQLTEDLGRANDKLAAAETEHIEAAAKLSKKLQAAEAKALQLGKELRVERDERAKALAGLGEATAQLKVLWAAQAQHTLVVGRRTEERETKVRQLMDELEAEKAKSEAKVVQLGKELQAERDERAAEVKAVRADSLLKVINAERERYTAGLRHMRDLVLTLYPDVVDPSKLTLEAPSASSIPPGFSPRQAPEISDHRAHLFSSAHLKGTRLDGTLKSEC